MTVAGSSGASGYFDASSAPFAKIADSLQRSGLADAIAATSPARTVAALDVTSQLQSAIDAYDLTSPQWKDSMRESFGQIAGRWGSVVAELPSERQVLASFAAMVDVLKPRLKAAASITLDPRLLSALSGQWTAHLATSLLDSSAFGVRALQGDALVVPDRPTRRGQPTNLQGLLLSDEELAELSCIATEESIAFAYAADKDTVTALLDASSAHERRNIITDRARHIEDHCEDVVRSLRSSAVSTYAARVLKQLDGLRDGHHDGAQAALTALLDHLYKQRDLKPLRTIVRQHETGKPPTLDNVDLYLIVPALSKIFQSYPMRGATVPWHAYNRHATLHSVDYDTQVTPTNAVVALMAVSSFLGFLDADIASATHVAG